MKPNSLQKQLLQKHRNNYRWIYNKAVNILDSSQNRNQEFESLVSRLNTKKEKIEKSSSSNYYSKFELRNLIVPEAVNSRTPWVLESGFQIRANAVFEAHKNFKTNIDLVKNGKKRFFDIKYKTKKDKKWTIDLCKENINYKTYCNKTEFSLYEESGFIKSREKFEINHDCSIHFDGIYYYLLVPYEKPVKESNADNFFVSLDPGIRKFQTCYSPDSNVNIIGVNASEKIYKLLLMIDKAISNKNKKLETKLRIRVKNLQKELHDKTSRFLCENYRNIYIPKLTEENDIINKNSRNLKTKTVRNMVLLAHCAFVEKLKTKALDYTNIKVQIVTEEYTSQTCLKCHTRTKTSNEIFKCKNCSFKIDRDILGSRNILLKTWDLM